MIINGETLDVYDYYTLNKKQSPNDEPLKPQIFMIFNAKDEIEPHDFLQRDPLVSNGWVKEWYIKEMDLVHAERDDELVLRG